MTGRVGRGIGIVTVAVAVLGLAGCYEKAPGDQLHVTSVTIDPAGASRQSSTAAAEEARGSVYKLPVGVAGTLTVHFTDSDHFAHCTLNLGGSALLPVHTEESGYFVELPTDALVGGIRVEGSLTCDKQQAFWPVETDIFTVLTGTTPVLVAEPTAIDFGTVAVGAQSAPARVTVLNAGDSALRISGVSITETAPFVISRDTCRTRAVAPNARCTFDIAFAPKAVHYLEATLTFDSNSQVSATSIALVADGAATQAPAFAASPGSLTFGDRPVGTAGDLSLQVSNTGVDPLTVSGAAIVGPDSSSFSLPLGTCRQLIVIHRACLLNVRFAPVSAGAKSATLRFTDDARGSPHDVPLTGTGTAVSTAPPPYAPP